MELKKFIKKVIREHLNENVDTANLKDILLKRIPFLKEYTIFKHPRDEKRLVAQRIIHNENVKVIVGDDILTFPRYDVSSDIMYYQNKIHDNTFHHFIVENKFHVSKPKEMDDILFTVFLLAKKQLEENLSYSKELVTSNNENMSKNELNEIINDINGILFKIEEFTDERNINLF